MNETILFQKLEKIENTNKLLIKATVKLLSELENLKNNIDIISDSINILLEIENSKLQK